VMHRPALVIADEPTSALDIITQSEILSLFEQLSRTLGISILYISHDLLSVATISNRMAVLSGGRIVECRPTTEIFRDPSHPYTRQLIRALPVMPQLPDFHARQELGEISEVIKDSPSAHKLTWY
jgi:ABC-type dipeptide/oligopeptide/nickel transport system ATPase component